MSEEQHTPYYSTRVRIADVKSPKELIGLKERTVEVIIGNTKAPVTKTNPNDLADVESKDMVALLKAGFEDSDKVAKDKGYKFIDQVKEYKDDS